MTKPILKTALSVTELSSDQLNWIKQQLTLGEYFKGDVAKALAEFKEDFYLAYPELVGQTTIDALSELSAKQEVTEQEVDIPAKLNTHAGQKTGETARLPLVGLVYSNQWINSDIPLTWGEMTKKLARLPENEEVVKALLDFAIVFGQVRDKFGSALAVNSGYRPKSVNKTIGGASSSQHINGTAADIKPLNGKFPQLLEVIKANE